MNTGISRRTAAKAAAAAFAAPLALGACGRGRPDHPTDVSADDIDEAMRTPTEITFWSWVPGIEDEIAMFESAYPAISVKLINAGQGEDHYTKLRTALRAVNGAPDVAQMEFQMIESFAITDDLLDLRPYGAEELTDQFVEFAWSQVTGTGGEIWAIPQDTGPMGLLYRTDLFESHGIEVPRTWNDFAEAARAFREAEPDAYLGNIAPNQGAFFAAMLWQAGADPFAGSDGADLRVDLSSEEAVRVASFWGDLAAQDLIATDADFNDQWYQALNRGKYATWVAPAWGPTFLTTAAEATSGNWRVAPLPQWEADAAPVSSNWGGSTSAVMSTTEHPIPAAVFAQFINTDRTSIETMAFDQFLFPPTTTLLDDPDFTGQELDFYGGQEVNALFAEISETVAPDFQWSPFQGQVYADFTETVGTALTNGDDAVEAMGSWRERIVEFAENQGFTVSRT